MSWVTITMDPDHSKAKVNKYYLKKIVLDIVRGDQFMYILLEVDYKYSVNGYNLSFFNFSLLSLLLGFPF